MGIRQFKPVTPATRFRSVSDFAEITRGEPERSLLEPLKRKRWPPGYWQSWGKVPDDFEVPRPLPGRSGSLDLD